jgi:hypothetical protein
MIIAYKKFKTARTSRLNYFINGIWTAIFLPSEIKNKTGASKNSEFAQMQGAGKISQRRICLICQQEIFFATPQLG